MPGWGEEILAAHQRTRESYSAERLHSDLADHGVQAPPYRVRRLRKKLGLRCKQKRKFKVSTDSAHKLPVAPNALIENCGGRPQPSLGNGHYLPPDR